MSLMASLKRMRYARKTHETLLGKAAFHSLFVAGVGLCLGIGAGTAAATTLQEAVGPLTFDFLYPNITTDQNLGMFAFPDTGQTVRVPFGVGVQTQFGTTIRNIFEIDVTPTTITVSYLDPTNTIGFTNNANAIIKMTTTQSSLINRVSLESETGITLNPGAFLFGSNFFQVDLSHNSLISPGATLDFSASYNVSATETPVPEPASLPLLASGLVALALTCRAIRMGVRRGSGRAETA
jgi:hypothetical protein